MGTKDNQWNIVGAKKGGGSGFKEQDNTLKSASLVRLLEYVSVGPIVGLVDGAASIYLNNTPLQEADGTPNFGTNIAWDERTGLPEQDYMAGFPSAEAEFSVDKTITTAVPAVYTTSTPDVDAVRVTLTLAEGLQKNNTKKNELGGWKVEFAIDRRIGAGTWEFVQSVVIDGMATTPYEEGHRVERPAGSEIWSVRIRRITEDDQSATVKSTASFSRATEIKDVKLSFDGAAYIGIAVDAESVSASSVPTRSYLIDGRYVRMPSNYDPVTRVYTGTWDGTFKWDFSNNPAWVLMDLLLDVENGLGTWVDLTMIDTASFYAAAVYNDQLVDDGNGGTEPRFTFNYLLKARQDAAKWLSDIANTMNAKLLWMGNRATIVQDRPASAVQILNRSSVVDGRFTYGGTALGERYNAVCVTWNNPAERYADDKITIDQDNLTGPLKTLATTALTNYGYNEANIVALGCTSEGQARRAARWYLYTCLSQTQTVEFSMSLNGFSLRPGQVVSIFNDFYANKVSSGRLAAGSTTTSIKLDQPIALAAGAKIYVTMPDLTIESRNIVQTSGSLSTISLSSALPIAPQEYATFYITTGVEAQQYRIVKTSQDDGNKTVKVSAILHDPNKYNLIETGVAIPAPVYSAAPSSFVSAPRNLLFREIEVNEDNTIKRTLSVGWERPDQGIVTGYEYSYRVDTGTWITGSTNTQLFEIKNATVGKYEVKIVARSFAGNASQVAAGVYTIATDGLTASPLNAPTTLVEASTGSANAFSLKDLNVKWTNPASNEYVNTATLRDFEVRVIDTATQTTLRTVYVPAVDAGQAQTYTYSYAMNEADGGPRRDIKVEVRCRDVKNNLSAPVAGTFTNAAPGGLTGISVSGSVGQIYVKYSKPAIADFGGVLVWMSTTSGFTPSSSNLVYDGTDTVLTLQSSGNVAHYVKLAAYDTFGKSVTGSGMTVSTQYSATPASNAGIPGASTNPGTGTKGDLFFNTTDNKLYRHDGTAWTAAVPTTDLSGQIAGTQLSDGAVTAAKLHSTIAVPTVVSSLPTTGNTEGRLVFLTTDDKLYRYNGTAWTVEVDGADIKANSIVAGKIAAGAIGADAIAANAITAGKIAADAVTTDKIAANAVTANELAANAVVAGKIAANAVTAETIAASTITADKIDSRGLSIKDDAGNVILSAGSGITTTYLRSPNGESIASGAMLGSALVSLGVDRVASVSAGYSDYVTDSGATGGSCFRYWRGWTGTTYLNSSTRSQVKIPGIVQGKKYRIVVRAKKIGSPVHAWLGAYNNTQAAYAFPQVNILPQLTTSWQTIDLGVMTPNWATNDNVYMFFGASGMSAGDSSANAVCVDWIAFQSANAEDGANATSIDASGKIQGVASGAGTTVSNALVPASGGNLLRNGRWVGTDTAGWTKIWENGPGAGSYGATCISWASAYALGGVEGGYLAKTGGGVSGGNGASVVDLRLSTPVQVTPGKRYHFSCLMAPHRAFGSVHVLFLNAAGGEVSWGTPWDSYAAPQYQGRSGGQNSLTLADYLAASAFVDVPAGIAFAVPMIRLSSVAGTQDHYLFFARAMFCEVAPEQTVSAPWDAGVPQINASNASTYIANAAIGSAQVGTLVAGNIDARGLSIKNANGDVLLAAAGAAVPPWVVALDSSGGGTSLVEPTNSSSNTALLRSLIAGDGIDLDDSNQAVRITSQSPGFAQYLPSDQAFTATGQYALQGMYVPLEANTMYLISGVLLVRSAAATTGLTIGCSVPNNAATTFTATCHTTSAGGSERRSTHLQYGNTGAVTFTAIFTSLSNAATTYSAAGYTTVPFEALVKVGTTAGNFQLVCGSEVASSTVTVAAGSYMRSEKLNRPALLPAAVPGTAPFGIAATYTGYGYSYGSKAYGYVQITFKQDGSWFIDRAQNGTVTGRWLTAGVGNDYDIKFVPGAFSSTVSLSNGGVDYAQLSSSRGFTATVTAMPGGYKNGSGSVTIYLRNRSTGVETLVQTVAVSLSVEAEYSGGIIP